MAKHAWRSLSRSVLVFTNVLFLLLGSVLVSIGGASSLWGSQYQWKWITNERTFSWDFQATWCLYRS